VFNRIRSWLSPATVLGGFTLLVVGAIGMAAFVGGFNVFAAYTNRTEFCISCHTMQNGPYAEYKKTIHFNNRTGVQAGCADCHLPKDFFPKLLAKVWAAKDVYHEIMGTIDTPEKFEERRLHMAKNVWAYMEKTESRSCRGCHDFDAMKLDEQGRRAKLKHPQAKTEGKHCINCHKGVAHELPQGYEGD
jgi:nitrate/TMAO reductase-like tetraheme cytochrome c subunit